MPKFRYNDYNGISYPENEIPSIVTLRNNLNNINGVELPMQNRFSEIFLSHGINYFTADKPLQEVMRYLGTREYGALPALGSYVSSKLIESLDYIDHYGKPVLQTWSLMGERIDYVRISPDHARVLQELQDYDVIRSIRGNPSDLMQHFLSGYLISDSGIFCTLTLTAQTAYIVQKYASNELKEKFLSKFFDPENPWYGATFYTEVQGGSDLGANRTMAFEENGLAMLTGQDKYFASDSGIADAALVTARFNNSPVGAKGISLFLVPSHLEDGSPNYAIRRLKNKLGTTAVPTGEVEFSKSTAFQIGDQKNGIYLAMEALVISRLDDAIAAVGIARKSLWEAFLYTQKREAFGKKLIEHPLMKRDLVELETSMEAALVLSLIAAEAFNRVCIIKPPYNEEYQLARILGNIAKTIAAEISSHVTRYSMEILGGIGFLEEFPMAKFHRDSVVTSIWEGTSNVQALEVMEVLLKPKGMDLIEKYLDGIAGKIRDREFGALLTNHISISIQRIKEWFSSGEPEYYAKEALFLVGNIVAACEMELVAQDNPGGVFSKSARLFFSKAILGKSPEHHAVDHDMDIVKWMGRDA